MKAIKIIKTVTVLMTIILTTLCIAERHAVLVGVSDYDGDWNDLSYCDDDARGIYDVLTNSLDWLPENIEVLIDTNATEENIKMAIERMGARASSDDICLFSFSGHGGYIKDSFPIDEYDGLDETIYPYYINENEITDDELGDWLAALPTKKVVAYFDTCFSGGQIANSNILEGSTQLNSRKYVERVNKFATGSNSGKKDRYKQRIKTVPWLPKLESERDGFINDLSAKSRPAGGYTTFDVSDLPEIYAVAACDTDELSVEDPSLMHGLFTYALLNSLKNADVNQNGWASGEETFKILYDEVVARSEIQHPMEIDSYPGEAEVFAVYNYKTMEPPTNDNFSAAIFLSEISGTVTGSNFGAGNELNEPDIGWNYPIFTVWYKWVAPSNGGVKVDTHGSDFNTIIGVFTGNSLEDLQEIASNDDAVDVFDYTSSVTVPIEKGETYYFVVDGYWEPGNITLNWKPVTLFDLNNDNFRSAYQLPSESGTLTTHNFLATPEYSEPGHGSYDWGKKITFDGPYHSLWFTIKPSKDVTLEFNTEGSSFDTVIAVYNNKSKLKKIKRIAFNDDVNWETLSSKVVFKAKAGHEYYIAVDGLDGEDGIVILNWMLHDKPANDDFASAQELSKNTGYVLANNSAATAEKGEESHGLFDYYWEKNPKAKNSIWYKYTPETDGQLLLKTYGSEIDTVIAVYVDGDSLKTIRRVALADNFGVADSGNERYPFHVFKDKTYYIVIDGYKGEIGKTVLTWIFSQNPPDSTELWAKKWKEKNNLKNETIKSLLIGYDVAPPLDLYFEKGYQIGIKDWCNNDKIFDGPRELTSTKGGKLWEYKKDDVEISYNSAKSLLKYNVTTTNYIECPHIYLELPTVITSNSVLRSAGTKVEIKLKPAPVKNGRRRRKRKMIPNNYIPKYIKQTLSPKKVDNNFRK